jgi:hypothetical protein
MSLPLNQVLLTLTPKGLDQWSILSIPERRVREDARICKYADPQILNLNIPPTSSNNDIQATEILSNEISDDFTEKATGRSNR